MALCYRSMEKAIRSARPIMRVIFQNQKSFSHQTLVDESISAPDTLTKPLIRKHGAVLVNPRSEYRVAHHYQGKVKGVVLDWAGTVLDCGVYAPATAFAEVFKREGIVLTMDEAREPMGTHKKVHIEKVTQIETVRKKWFDQFGRYPNKQDVERMYSNFVPVQLGCLKEYSSMIIGAVDTVKFLKEEMNLKIGSTTGFTSDMINILKIESEKAGYLPDCIVTADQVPQARPFPYMVWMNCVKLDLNPIQAVVKVDDTADGVREGILAGCWSIGLARTGNYVALNEDEIAQLTPEDYERRLKRSYDILANAGAHYVIDTINDLPPVIHDINRRLAGGEKP